MLVCKQKSGDFLSTVIIYLQILNLFSLENGDLIWQKYHQSAGILLEVFLFQRLRFFALKRLLQSVYGLHIEKLIV